MLTHFGWKAVLGILAANLSYFLIIRKALTRLQKALSMKVSVWCNIRVSNCHRTLASS